MNPDFVTPFTGAARPTRATLGALTIPATDFERLAGVSAWLAGAAALGYSLAFLGVLPGSLAPVFMLSGALLAGPALLAIYYRLLAASQVHPGFALWGVLLALAGLLGALVHAGYDLSALTQPFDLPGMADLPHPFDPRGLLTFGVAGLGVLLLSLLTFGGRVLPRGLSALGVLLGILMVVIYLARLIILQAANPLVLLPAALTGLLVNPLWYLWLGFALRRAWRAA